MAALQPKQNGSRVTLYLGSGDENNHVFVRGNGIKALQKGVDDADLISRLGLAG